MKTVEMDDAALAPYQDMYSVQREQYGFTPLPKSGRVSIEGKSKHGGYDAMLHFGGMPSRTIAFRRIGDKYEWFGEQEIFEGPHTIRLPMERSTNRLLLRFTKKMFLVNFKV